MHNPLKRWVTGMRRMFSMLSIKRIEMVLVIGQVLLLAVFEGVGIGMIYPVLSYIENPDEVSGTGSAAWQAMLGLSEWLGIPLTLGSLLVLAFIPILIRQFVYFGNQWYVATIQQRTITRLRSDAFGAIAHGDVGFVVAEGEGNLVALMSTQVNRAGQAVFQFVNLIANGLLVATYFVILFALQPELTAVALVAVAAIGMLVKGNINRSRAYGKDAVNLGNRAISAIAERLSAMRLIKMRGQEDSETERITTLVRDLEQAQVKIAVARAAVEITVDPALMLSVFVIIFVGVTYFGTTLASLGLFLFVLLRLNGASKTFNVGRQALWANYDALVLVHSVIDRARASRRIIGGGRKFEGLTDGIRFDHVSFKYAEEDAELVLADVDFEIRRGSLTAFVGKSGAGKSTLVDLVPRLRDVTSGQVLFDDVAIQDLDLRSLRRRIGFMTQDAVMFADTIRENLIYGLEREVDEAEIRSALDRAYCTFVYDIPEGLDTNIGDRGVRLSGGQRQRLALARVLLQDPDILILDEPTSALDSESEQFIQQALDELRGYKTLIVIAHRLSTVQRADQVLVLEKGVIVERGTHAELLELGGAYRRLFDLQIYG